ncbi:hypothetical protein Pyn_40886 [Prunus yedoensis var. nudiflora]|uniref:Uncharacterized protein n=1 Tax=Prunus yedoensis var. nudiflora TaxID=2094558 RepID=A0A314XYV8_PRUYE|nr:hypothetical protein Pyn_40886 [Prunus yedoensis var. nudiflora]
MMGVVIGNSATSDRSGKRHCVGIDDEGEYMIDSGIDFSGQQQFDTNGFADTVEETSLERSPRLP